MYSYDPKCFPTGPGCYLMKEATGIVIYVGKAKNLRRRLASYFTKRVDHWRTRELVRRVDSIEIILVRNETESLVLENNLIKHYHPRYNVMLQDERFSYGYLALTNEVIPRLVPYKRKWVNKEMGDVDTGRLFGPYLSSSQRYTLMNYVNDRFQLRTCCPLPKRVCIRYEIGACSGICEGYVTQDQYVSQMRHGVGFLRKSRHQVLRDIRLQVTQASEDLAYERAQRYATLLEALEATLQNQVVERDVHYNQDVLFFGEKGILRMQIKAGKLLYVDVLDNLHGLYKVEPPKEIITNDADAVSGGKSRVTVPKRGTKRALLLIAELNWDYRLGVLRYEAR